MKKVMTIFGAILFASTILTSCGGGGKSETDVKLKSTDVTGELSEYFTAVEGTYKLTTDGEKTGMKGVFNYQVKVQIKRTDKDYDFNAVDLENRGYFMVVCDLLDEQGVPLVTADREGMRSQGVNSEDAAFASLKPGETGWAIFSFTGDKETMEKVKLLQIGSKANMEQADNSSSSSSSEVTEGSSSSSVDCDQFIKDYSDFVDSYVKLLKKYKANPTDASILTEYTEAAQKAAEMQTDASSCTDPKYATKLMELANKIAKAAM